MIKRPDFIIDNQCLLSYAFFFNFFSSFGQTFFISLFVPYWIAILQINHTAFGSIYSLLTISSAILLSFAGKYIDRTTIKKYSIWVFFGLLLAVLMLSQAREALILVFALFLTRFFGQGLMTHAASTSVAKCFEKNRGKALAFTSLGHPVGQFVLPLLALPLMDSMGWRWTLMILVGLAVLVVVPVLINLNSDSDPPPEYNTIQEKSFIVFLRLIHSVKFWIIGLNVLLVPLACTVVFLYQQTIVESKGWDFAWGVFSFTLYPIFSAMATLVSGFLVDRFSALSMFRLFLVPMFIAFIFMFLSNNPYVLPVFYMLLGLSSGLQSSVQTSTIAEIYGTNKLGEIRGYFATLSVFGAAIGPPIFGNLFDRQVSMPVIMLVFACLVLLVIISSFILKMPVSFVPPEIE